MISFIPRKLRGIGVCLKEHPAGGTAASVGTMVHARIERDSILVILTRTICFDIHRRHLISARRLWLSAFLVVGRKKSTPGVRVRAARFRLRPAVRAPRSFSEFSSSIFEIGTGRPVNYFSR
jgi:hypothetical protein